MTRGHDTAHGAATTGPALRRARTTRRALGVAAFVSGLVVCGVASAYWSAPGTGAASASTTTLAAPTGVTATAGPAAGQVSVSFTGVTPPSGSVDGYVVTRHQGLTSSPACGTDPGLPGTWLSAATLSCVDSGVASGSYTYRATARFRTWTATSAPSGTVTVVADSTAPTQVVTVASGDAHISGTTLYYRTGAPGSFTLQSSVTDNGSGPASAQFPTTSGGVSHTNETVSHQTGPLPTRVYTSSPFTWTANDPVNPSSLVVTARDVANNASTTTLTFVKDASAPTGGALTVNGTAGTVGGSTSNSTSGTWSAATVTQFNADTGSGLASSVLTREDGSFVNGECVGWGAPVTVSGVAATGYADGCYRYTLTGTDRVGNTAVRQTTVRVDRTAPTMTLVVNPISNGPGWYDAATSTLWVDKNPTGSFRITAVVTDDASGPASAQFRTGNSGWSHTALTQTNGTGSAPTIAYQSNVWSWNQTNNNVPGAANRQVTARDAFGNAFDLTPTWSIDNNDPTGGALNVNGTAATAGGSTSTTPDTTWNVTRTSFTDAGSGVVSNELVRETATLNGTTCGTFGAATVVPPEATEDSGVAERCYRYTFTGTDNLGHTSSLVTTVRVNPPGPYVTNLALNNGGGNAGQMEDNDTIVVTFSEQMNVSTFCSTWTNSNSNQSITANDVVFVRLVNAPSNANDYLEVRTTNAACGGSFRLGTITLGSPDHIINNPWTDFGGSGGFASTISWNAGARQMTIVLGRGSVGPGTLSNVVGNAPATFTPHAALRGTASATLGVWNVFETTSRQHF